MSVGLNGQSGWGDSQDPSMSADGRFVAFASQSPTLVEGDGNFHSDVFVRDLAEGTTTLVSVS